MSNPAMTIVVDQAKQEILLNTSDKRPTKRSSRQRRRRNRSQRRNGIHDSHGSHRIRDHRIHGSHNRERPGCCRPSQQRLIPCRRRRTSPG
jgi:hypothetical protein